ncbi:hypothetical protein B0H16DRAFT_1580031 [Mycena metata]|uniref:Uncharacterized protein n=1 Tax=Mycena metata TaxID=1033252 RepID=A0AAD7I1X5_9AGAR|nr:hypothetical protein B0H16DRAFT_1580031 [Mycena metata]
MSSRSRHLLAFGFALLVAVVTGSPSSGSRCQPVSLAELKAMPFWHTFYDRLGIIVWGDAHAFDHFKSQGTYPKLETTFDDGSENAEVCSEGEALFQPTNEPICLTTATYTHQTVTGASGTIRLDYPTGLSTVVFGTITMAAPLTGGRTYETAFRVQDVTPPDSSPGTTGGTYTMNATYPDVEENSFAADGSRESEDYMIVHELQGDICWIRYDSTTCIQDTTGQVTFSLYGAVRVGFDSPENGHYYWILWFDGWVPQDQLTSYSQFNATITTTGSNHHIPRCNYQCSSLTEYC